MSHPGGISQDELRRHGPDGTPQMFFILRHQEILGNELISGATAATFQRFPELHARARELRDIRLEPVMVPAKSFHDGLKQTETECRKALEESRQSFEGDPRLASFNPDQQITIMARNQALGSMANRALGGGGAGGQGEAFRQDLTVSAAPCYSCRGLWRWTVARQSTTAELDEELTRWYWETHGAVPHRCAETAAFLELQLRENNMN